MDPFWLTMALACVVVQLFTPWWISLILLWAGWQYLKMAGE